MARLILDTGLLISGARAVQALSEVVSTEDDLALPALVVAEYLEGVHLTADEARKAHFQAFLDRLLGSMPVIDYDTQVAEHHASLMAHVRRSGTRRGAHDLIIAATARATGRTILTRDARARFDELPAVRAQLVGP